MCKEASGLFNPGTMYNRLNDMQKQEDPKAYQPEVVAIIERKKQRMKEMKAEAEKKAQE